MSAKNGTPREAGQALRSNRTGAVERIRLAAWALSNFGYEAHRYLRHSYLFIASSRDQIAVRIMAGAHFLEYGMAWHFAKRAPASGWPVRFG